MGKAKAGLRQKVTFGVEHRKADGALIHREATRTPAPECKRTPRCIVRFSLTLWWDSLRVAYCEKYRDAELPEYIRMGDVADKNIVKEILRIYHYRLRRR